MLCTLRYHVSGLASDPSWTAVLLWRAGRMLQHRSPGRLLLAALPLVAALALWAQPSPAPTPLPGSPVAVAAGLDGQLLVATADGRVWELAGTGPRLLGAVAGRPVALAADPGSGRVYVATADAITALDGSNAVWKSTPPRGESPIALALDPTAGRLYVLASVFDSGEANGGSLLALDARTGRGAAVPAGSAPAEVAVDPATHRVFVAEAGVGLVLAFAGKPLAVVAIYRVGGEPSRLAVDARAGRVYVADSTTGRLAMIDEATGAVTWTALKGIHPSDIAVDPASGNVFVASSESGAIAVLRGDWAPLAALHAVAAPYDLVADPDGGRFYTIDLSTNSVWQIEGRRRGPDVRLLAQASVRESPLPVAPG